MTTEQVLNVVRRLMNEVDITTSDLTDEEILAQMSDERDRFEIEGLTGFEDLAIGTDQTEPTTYGIVPDAALDEGHLLALATAASILRAVYAAKVSRGELGISWSSGLESESTLQAGRTYLDAVTNMELEVERKKVLKMAGQAGKRQQ
jgi:hypothetical protein